MKSIACCISKQRTLQPSSHCIKSTPKVSPEETQAGNWMPASSSQSLHPSPHEYTLKKLRMTKYKTLALDSWGADPRTNISQPGLLKLPMLRKALNSLTWDVWFSLITSKLFRSQLPGLYCTNIHMSWLQPASSEESLRATWEAVSWAEVLSFVSKIKCNSQLLGGVLFFFFKSTRPVKKIRKGRKRIQWCRDSVKSQPLDQGPEGTSVKHEQS